MFFWCLDGLWLWCSVFGVSFLVYLIVFSLDVDGIC